VQWHREGGAGNIANCQKGVTRAQNSRGMHARSAHAANAHETVAIGIAHDQRSIARIVHGAYQMNSRMRSSRRALQTGHKRAGLPVDQNGLCTGRQIDARQSARSPNANS
jgi:hypothetical protein